MIAMHSKWYWFKVKEIKVADRVGHHVDFWDVDVDDAWAATNGRSERTCDTYRNSL